MRGGESLREGAHWSLIWLQIISGNLGNPKSSVSARIVNKHQTRDQRREAADGSVEVSTGSSLEVGFRISTLSATLTSYQQYLAAYKPLRLWADLPQTDNHPDSPSQNHTQPIWSNIIPQAIVIDLPGITGRTLVCSVGCFLQVVHFMYICMCI